MFDWSLRIEMELDNIKDWFVKYNHLYWFKDPNATENRVRGMLRELISDVKGDTFDEHQDLSRNAQSLLKSILNRVDALSVDNRITALEHCGFRADIQMALQQLKKIEGEK